MEQYHRNVINTRMADLIAATSNLESIVQKLLDLKIINKWMENHILGGEKESILAKFKLYELIQGRGPTAFTELCNILEETGNIKASNILLLSDQSVVNLDLGSFEQFNTSFNNTSLEYVKIHPERKRMDNNIDNLPTGAYPMGSNPKGYALILNINNIKDKDERTGSSVDMENLIQLFKCLGFIVDPKVDLTEKEIKNFIKEFINICHVEKANSIVVFVMSHGEAGKDSRSSDILTADGITINTDWIVEQFIPNNICRNIPKLFFIQACRGNNNDFGWRYPDGQNNSIQNDSGDLYDRQDRKKRETIYNRRYEDVFIAYATVPGYTAKRHPTDGSWFVQKLCEVIRQNSYNTDLTSMMQLVDIQIKKLNSFDHGFQTVEWSSRGFNKKFYFNPGLYDDNADYGTLNPITTNPTDV